MRLRADAYDHVRTTESPGLRVGLELARSLRFARAGQALRTAETPHAVCAPMPTATFVPLSRDHAPAREGPRSGGPRQCLGRPVRAGTDAPSALRHRARPVGRAARTGDQSAA